MDGAGLNILIVYGLAAAAIAALARFLKGRSLILWFLGSLAALALGEIPLRFLVAISPGPRMDRDATTIAVTTLIGVILLLIVAGIGRRARAGPTRTCPRCAETIKAAARVCRFCGHDSAAPRAS